MTYQRNETPEPLASDMPTTSKKPFHPQADYVLDLLVAAGRLTREKAFQARDIAVEFGPGAATPAPGVPAEPAWFKQAPIVPTVKMCEAGASSIIAGMEHRSGTSWAEEAAMAYRAMLDAAPGAPGQEAAAVQAVRTWQDIATAPKDGTKVLVAPGLWNDVSCSVAHYDEDKYAKRPRPFWNRSDGLGRVSYSREKPPTHWHPLPPPPSGAGEKP